MLSEKPWKLEALLRLLVGVFICVATGATALNATQFSNASGVSTAVFFALVCGVLVCAVISLWMVRRPWPIETFTRHLMVLLGCLYLVIVLGSLVQHLADKSVVVNPVLRMIMAAISFQGSVLVLTCFFLHKNQIRWTEAFGFGNNRQRALLFGAVAACIFFPLGWGLQWASAQVLSHVSVTPAEQQAVQTLRATEGWLVRLVLAGMVIVIAPLAEEILFRGLLYPTIKQAGFPRAALWSTALLFAIVHQNAVTFLPLLVLALILTMLYELTNNLLASIVTHSLFNAINFMVLYWFQSKLGQSPGP